MKDERNRELDLDEQLVSEAQRAGNVGRKAFDQLVKRHQGWVIRYLTHLLGDSDDAHDIGQEAFARAYLGLSGLRDGRTFRGWLRRIATRLAFNRRRDKKTRKGYEQKSAPEELYYTNGSAAHAKRQAILRVLDELSYPYREVLVMHYIEELSVGEMAALLDIGKSAAKMRLSRARKEFKTVYERMTSDE